MLLLGIFKSKLVYRSYPMSRPNIKLTPNSYNGMNVKLLVDVKNTLNFLNPQEIIKAGTVGQVVKFSPALSNFTLDFDGVKLTVHSSKTEVVY
jgi:hypothetical protein